MIVTAMQKTTRFTRGLIDSLKVVCGVTLATLCCFLQLAPPSRWLSLGLTVIQCRVGFGGPGRMLCRSVCVYVWVCTGVSLCVQVFVDRTHCTRISRVPYRISRVLYHKL